MTVYHAHVDGFFGTFLSLDDLRTWAISRRDERGCKGKTLTILQGKRYGRGTETADVFNGRSKKEIVL